MGKEKFTKTEPGISHPLTQCTVRLTDDGRICLMAGDSCGIILDQETGVISFFGTEVRMPEKTRFGGKKISSSVLEITGKPNNSGLKARMIDRIVGERSQ